MTIKKQWGRGEREEGEREIVNMEEREEIVHNIFLQILMCVSLNGVKSVDHECEEFFFTKSKTRSPLLAKIKTKVPLIFFSEIFVSDFEFDVVLQEKCRLIFMQ
jgi:hypothetical protein